MTTPPRKTPVHKKKFPKASASEGALTMDLSDHVKAARAEWVVDMYSSMMPRIAIVRKLKSGRPANGDQIELPPVSDGAAYAYFDLGLAIMKQELAGKREERMEWHRSQLYGLARLARALSQPAEAARILDRVALLDGLDNRFTAVKAQANTAVQVVLPPLFAYTPQAVKAVEALTTLEPSQEQRKPDGDGFPSLANRRV